MPAVVTVPIAEELAFRGYLHRRLIDVDFDHVSLRRFTWLAFVAFVPQLLAFYLPATRARIPDAWAAASLAMGTRKGEQLT